MKEIGFWRFFLNNPPNLWYAGKNGGGILKTVLTIAGSDPLCGAGVQIDLATFQKIHVQGVCAVTAVTAQNKERFYSLNPVKARLLREQLQAVSETVRLDAIKIGMLGTEENVFAVIRFLEKMEELHGPQKVILDTVFRSSTGMVLLEPKGVEILRQFLIQKCTLVTPNLDEAEKLTRLKVRSVEAMKEAALHLHAAHPGVQAILIKGGHLEKEATDVLYDGDEWTFFPARRKYDRDVHGTGCAMSAAIAAYLARGENIKKSVEKAKEYISLYIRQGQKPIHRAPQKDDDDEKARKLYLVN